MVGENRSNLLWIHLRAFYENRTCFSVNEFEWQTKVVPRLSALGEPFLLGGMENGFFK